MVGFWTCSGYATILTMKTYSIWLGLLLIFLPFVVVAQGLVSPEVGAGTFNGNARSGSYEVKSSTGLEGSPEVGAGTYNNTGQVRTDTYGRDSGLVPAGCSGPDCNFCHVIQLVNNIVTWLVTFLSVVAVIALVIAGARMVTSGGDVSTLQNAKSTFVNILIGFILVLASWLIVDTILKAITEDGQGLEFWGKVPCGQQLGAGE